MPNWRETADRGFSWYPGCPHSALGNTTSNSTYAGNWEAPGNFYSHPEDRDYEPDSFYPSHALELTPFPQLYDRLPNGYGDYNTLGGPRDFQGEALITRGPQSWREPFWWDLDALTAAGILVTPDTASLVLASFAPSVLTPVLVTPGFLALTTSLFTPSVTIGVRVTPEVAALVTSLFAPTVTTTANQLVTPGTAVLLTSLFAPSVVVGVRVVPDTATLIITTFNPTVTGGGLVEHHFTVGRSGYKHLFRDSLKNYLPEG